MAIVLLIRIYTPCAVLFTYLNSSSLKIFGYSWTESWSHQFIFDIIFCWLNSRNPFSFEWSSRWLLLSFLIFSSHEFYDNTINSDICVWMKKMTEPAHLEGSSSFIQTCINKLVWVSGLKNHYIGSKNYPLCSRKTWCSTSITQVNIAGKVIGYMNAMLLMWVHLSNNGSSVEPYED